MMDVLSDYRAMKTTTATMLCSVDAAVKGEEEHRSYYRIPVVCLAMVAVVVVAVVAVAFVFDCSRIDGCDCNKRSRIVAGNN